MKFVPALLIVVFVIGTAIMTRLAMRERIEPQASAAAVRGRDTLPAPASASVDDLRRHFADVPIDDLRDRLRSLDLPRSLIEEVVTARIIADAEARTHELAKEQRTFQIDLSKTFLAPRPPAIVAPPTPDPPKVEFVIPEKRGAVEMFLRDFPLPGATPENKQ